MITKVKYTDLDHTQVRITLDDGREMFAGVKGATWLHAELNEWLESNTPEPWKTEQEIYDDAVISVRSKRNQLLKDSDWAILPDAPTDKEVWAIYRQQLRDVTEQPGFPFDVVFPEAP